MNSYVHKSQESKRKTEVENHSLNQNSTESDFENTYNRKKVNPQSELQ